MNDNDNIVYTKPLGLAKLDIIESLLGGYNSHVQSMARRSTIITPCKIFSPTMKGENMRTALAMLTLIIPAYANADTCESIIGLSKITHITVRDQNSIEQNADYFCKEYSKGTSVSNNSKFGASYSVLSASFGSSNATVIQVASRYCSAESNYSESQDAYKQYIESIAPGAYDAYKQCTEAKNNMTYNVDSILPSEFSMSVGFASPGSHDKSASIAYSASNGVSCKWNDSETKSIVIPTGSTAILECSRNEQSKKAFVKIVRTDSTVPPPLTLSWQAYDNQDNPIDALTTIDDRLKNLEMELTRLQQNSVVGFMSDTCPSGWIPVLNAQGRFLRGIDSSGSTKIDPAGISIPGSIQEDMIAKHTHTYQSGFHSGESNNGTGADPNKKNAVLTSTDEGKSKDGELGPETRPKNMAVLFCTKERR